MQAKVTVKRRNSTLEVRTPTNVEYIDTTYKTKEEIFDFVKYAIITSGIRLSDVTITELIREA